MRANLLGMTPGKPGRGYEEASSREGLRTGEFRSQARPLHLYCVNKMRLFWGRPLWSAGLPCAIVARSPWANPRPRIHELGLGHIGVRMAGISRRKLITRGL